MWFAAMKESETAPAKCEYCGREAVYRCGLCGKMLCMQHVRTRTVCAQCIRRARFKCRIGRLRSEGERVRIRQLVKHFWNEQQQLAFDKMFTVADLPAFVARKGNAIIGFISFAEEKETIIIVALGVTPQYQGADVGRKLVEKIVAEAKRTDKKRLLVATSNDDLPALGFYQSLKFQIYEVKPNVIAEKHGKTLKGIAGLPIRDEIRLQRTI